MHTSNIENRFRISSVCVLPNISCNVRYLYTAVVVFLSVIASICMCVCVRECLFVHLFMPMFHIFADFLFVRVSPARSRQNRLAESASRTDEPDETTTILRSFLLRLLHLLSRRKTSNEFSNDCSTTVTPLVSDFKKLWPLDVSSGLCAGIELTASAK